MFHLWLWSPLSPPHDIPPAQTPCLQTIFPRVHLSLPSSCLLSVRFSFICRLPSSAGCHPPSARKPDWWPVPCCPWCPGQCPDVWGFAPPTCVAGGTWLGCGWRGVVDNASPIFLRSSMRLSVPTRPMGEVSSALLTPLNNIGACLCLPPPHTPSPFTHTTVLVPIPSLPSGEYFRGRPACPLPVGLPWPRTRRPPKHFQGPVPCPPSPFRCHARGPVAS